MHLRRLGLKAALGFTYAMTAERHRRQILESRVDTELIESSENVFCANAEKLSNIYAHIHINHASKLLLLYVRFPLPPATFHFPAHTSQHASLETTLHKRLEMSLSTNQAQNEEAGGYFSTHFKLNCIFFSYFMTTAINFPNYLAIDYGKKKI